MDKKLVFMKTRSNSLILKDIVFSNSEKEDEDYGAEGSYKKAVPKATILKTCEPGNIVFEVPFDKSEEIVFKQVIHGQ